MADDEEQLRESLKNHPHLTLEELREFKELFNLVDEDKGGSISPQELGSLMETLGLKPNQEELDAMIREIDEDGNGEIDFDEFVQVMSRKVQPTYTPEEVKGAFKVFETPNAGLPPGHVKTAALERALTTYGTEKLSLEEAQDLLSQVDPDHTGSINYIEYVNMMCST
mmetsp:Transcript_18528/g.44557  ORF Transcript_18528/g.44557 Transcript_18528/m.44557 type:complete len:168 (+) Transcript_18528:136-639(+)